MKACTGLALDESKQTDESIKTVSIKTTESTLETVETTETFVAVETIEEAPTFGSQAMSPDRHIDFIPLRSGERADEVRLALLLFPLPFPFWGTRATPSESALWGAPFSQHGEVDFPLQGRGEGRACARHVHKQIGYEVGLFVEHEFIRYFR